MLSAVWGLLFWSTSRTRHSNGEVECRLESWQPCRPFLPLIKPVPHFILICLSIKVFLEMWKQRLPISSSPLVSVELSRPCADKRVTCLPLSSISGGNNDYFLIGAEQSSGESGCYSNFPCRVCWASTELKEQLAADPSSHSQCQIAPAPFPLIMRTSRAPHSFLSPHSPHPSPACLPLSGALRGEGERREGNKCLWYWLFR